MRNVEVAEIGARPGRERIAAALTALWALLRSSALRIPHSALVLFFGWRFLLFLTVAVASQLGGAPPPR
jgi:hypothetical protein